MTPRSGVNVTVPSSTRKTVLKYVSVPPVEVNLPERLGSSRVPATATVPCAPISTLAERTRTLRSAVRSSAKATTEGGKAALVMVGVVTEEASKPEPPPLSASSSAENGITASLSVSFPASLGICCGRCESERVPSTRPFTKAGTSSEKLFAVACVRMERFERCGAARKADARADVR